MSLNDYGRDQHAATTSNNYWTARQDAEDREIDYLSWQAEERLIRADVRNCASCTRITVDGATRWRHCTKHGRELADHIEARPAR